MTSTRTPLTATNIHTLAPHPGRKGPRLIADGNGLYLQLMPSGTRSWIFRYTLAGRTRAMGLGPVRNLALSEARKRARELRVQVDQGIDPLAKVQLKSSLRRTANVVHRITFRRCAELYIDTHRAGWKSAKHADQWMSTLSQYAFPVIGNMPVADVGVEEVEKILMPIWPTINETASRIRGRIEKVLGWATVRNHRSGENPARWTGYLSEVFPKRSLIREVRHHSALPYREAPEFFQLLLEHNSPSAVLFAFLMLTAVRTTEARAAEWSEFDWQHRMWIIPTIRMKTKRAHRVPLSAQAMELLQRLMTVRNQLPGAEQSHFVFPSRTPEKCLSNAAMLALLKNGLGRKDITPHGMRSTFRDWVGECTEFHREVAEAALAHTLQSKVEAAYRRGDSMDKRRVLMQAWADYLAPAPNDV